MAGYNDVHIAKRPKYGEPRPGPVMLLAEYKDLLGCSWNNLLNRLSSGGRFRVLTKGKYWGFWGISAQKKGYFDKKLPQFAVEQPDHLIFRGVFHAGSEPHFQGLEVIIKGRL